MNLRDIFKKSEGSPSTVNTPNNQQSSVNEDENSPFTDLRNYALTWKERYEIALRFGVLIQIEGEKIEVPDFVKVKIIKEDEKNRFIANLPKNQKGQLMKHSEVGKFINIEDKLLNNGISAGSIKDKYLKELTIITIYLHQ